MFSKSTWPHLLTQSQSKYLLQKSPSWATLLTYSFLGNFNYLAFQKANKQAHRQVFLRGSKFFEILFFPQCIVRSNHGNEEHEIAVLHVWPKTLKNTFWGRLYSNTSIINIWNKPRGDHTQKASRKLINWYLLFATPIHRRSAMLISYVIQSCNIKAVGYEAKSTPKIEFSLCHIPFRGNVSCKKLSFSYGELNVVLAIQFSYRRIKLR